MRVDVHQHLWPEPLLEALRARSAPPRLRGWRLMLDGEPDHVADPADHDPAARAELALAESLDTALVSLSGPLGIEQLAPSEARGLLEAWHEGALGLPAPLRAWAAACLTELDPAALERELERGFVGLQLPATAVMDGRGWSHVAPLLDVLTEHGRPLFIHPGPAAAARDAPHWWPALVPYVQQMHGAWFAFRVHGRPRHPALRVCFAMLAGLAPLHGERFATRARQRWVVDPEAFLEVSSYGTRAIDATIRTLGIDVLVNGSDRPYAQTPMPDPTLGAAASAAICSANPLRLLDLLEVPA